MADDVDVESVRRRTLAAAEHAARVEREVARVQNVIAEGQTTIAQQAHGMAEDAERMADFEDTEVERMRRELGD